MLVTRDINHELGWLYRWMDNIRVDEWMEEEMDGISVCDKTKAQPLLYNSHLHQLRLKI